MCINKNMIKEENYQLIVLIVLLILIFFSLVTRVLSVSNKKTDESKRTKRMSTTNTPILFVYIAFMFLLVTALVLRSKLVERTQLFELFVSIIVLVYTLLEVTTTFMFIDLVTEDYVYYMNILSYSASVILVSIFILRMPVKSYMTHLSPSSISSHSM